MSASLVVAAQAAGHGKGTALGARYRALAARRGKKRAAVAVGHSTLLVAYHVLTDHQPYDERLHLAKPPRPVPTTRLVEQLQAQGYVVTIQPLDPAV
jgi:hypothetical protein